jgi:CRP-like cAMP-binding protein
MYNLLRKLDNFGILSEKEKDALLSIVGQSKKIKRGEDFIIEGSSPTHMTVLLEGLACRYKILEDGTRHIFAFQYGGDICDIQSFVLNEVDYAVAALRLCTVAPLAHSDVQEITEKHPNIARVLWRNSVIESRLSRQWLLNVGQRPALNRIAHILCEHTARLKAINENGRYVLITQAELADATGLSAVHINRTLHQLRELGIIAKRGRPVIVLRWDRLSAIAKFDGRYLHPADILTHGNPPRTA